MTKKITDNLPLVTALIIIISIVKLSLYYTNFSVPIKYFISFAEITTTVAEDLIFFVFIYVVILVSLYMFTDMKIKVNIQLSKNIIGLIYSIFLVLSVAGLMIWSFVEKPFYLRIINSAFLYLFIFLTFYRTEIAKNYFKKNKDFRFIVVYFISAIFYIVLSTSNEIISVSSGKYSGTKIVTNDSLYISNDKNYYIGQTENYLFLYNKVGNCTIIPTTTIKEIQIQMGNK